jgi:hypothetical protein
MISNETMNNDENNFNSYTKILMAFSLACICVLGVIGKLSN